MVCKRPFHDEESYEVGCKHPRQHGASQHSSIVGIAHFGDGPQKLFSDEGENSARSQNEGEIARDMVAGDLNGANKDVEMNASGNISSYLWVNRNAIDEHAESDAAVHLSYFPHYFELDHNVTAAVQPHDIYSFLLDHAPPKLVPIGADHQADVPEWAPKDFNQCYLERGSLRYGNVVRERSTSYLSERGTLGVDFFGSRGRNEIRLFGT